MAELFWFSDAQRARIAPLLPTNTRGMKRVDDRRVLSGIVHVLKSGGRWGDCPREYGPKKTLYNRFVRWAERGVWQRIFAALAGAEGAPDRLMIDSTSIKVHRCARGAKGGPGPCYWSQQRWTQHEGPSRHRRTRPTLRLLPDAGQCPRLCRRQAVP